MFNEFDHELSDARQEQQMLKADQYEDLTSEDGELVNLVKLTRNDFNSDEAYAEYEKLWNLTIEEYEYEDEDDSWGRDEEGMLKEEDFDDPSAYAQYVTMKIISDNLQRLNPDDISAEAAAFNTLRDAHARPNADELIGKFCDAVNPRQEGREYDPDNNYDPYDVATHYIDQLRAGYLQGLEQYLADIITEESPIQESDLEDAQ